MTHQLETSIQQFSLNRLKEIKGCVGVFVSDQGKMSQAARKVNSLSKGAIARLLADDDFETAKAGHVYQLDFLPGLQARKILVVKMPARPDTQTARKAGGALRIKAGCDDMNIFIGGQRGVEDIVLAILLRHYSFKVHKTAEDVTKQVKDKKNLTLWVNDCGKINSLMSRVNALVEGVYFTRDLVSEPANILTTTEFSKRVKELEKIGVEVEIFDEKDLEKKQMRLLLAVGHGSQTPSKLAVMRWQGARAQNPFALVGKGVVFDTGGISIKPAMGMEEMTMDMGGAAVVAGVMKTLALRKARVNVVGVIGLVENMPSGQATRPGDIVQSMKGETVEIINTDAEGRLVLADCLWYTQERFNPCAIVNFATLTGAIIIALGNDKAGVFSNDETLVGRILQATDQEKEGAWRLPLASCYDAQLKSRLADMKNVGTRAAGAITAAQFLQRFIKPKQPWAHIDIAGVTLLKKAGTLSAAGASGWGVLSVNRLIENHYENKT